MYLFYSLTGCVCSVHSHMMSTPLQTLLSRVSDWTEVETKLLMWMLPASKLLTNWQCHYVSQPSHSACFVILYSILWGRYWETVNAIGRLVFSISSFASGHWRLGRIKLKDSQQFDNACGHDRDENPQLKYAFTRWQRKTVAEFDYL